MKTCLSLFCLLLGLSPAAAVARDAPAQGQNPPGAAEIQALMAEGRFSEVLRASEKAARAHADDPEIRNLRGVALLSTLQYEKARDEFLQVLALDPDHQQAHANLGLIHGMLGQDTPARTYLERALALDPQDSFTRRELEELEVRSHIRRAGNEAPAAGSAAAMIHAFLSRVERGELEEAFSKYVDPAVLDALVRKSDASGRDSAEVRRDLLRGVRAGWSAQILKHGGKYLGFAVQREQADTSAAGVEGSVLVPSYVWIERVISGEDVASMRRMLNSPQLAEYVSPDIKAVIEGLEPDDRNAMFERLAGFQQNQLLPIRWRVIRSPDGRFLITDAIIGYADLVQISLSDFMDKMDAFAALYPEPDRGVSYERLGYNIGRVVGMLLVPLALGFLVLRMRSRRR